MDIGQGRSFANRKFHLKTPSDIRSVLRTVETAPKYIFYRIPRKFDTFLRLFKVLECQYGWDVNGGHCLFFISPSATFNPLPLSICLNSFQNKPIPTFKKLLFQMVNFICVHLEHVLKKKECHLKWPGCQWWWWCLGKVHLFPHWATVLFNLWILQGLVGCCYKGICQQKRLPGNINVMICLLWEGLCSHPIFVTLV